MQNFEYEFEVIQTLQSATQKYCEKLEPCNFQSIISESLLPKQKKFY